MAELKKGKNLVSLFLSSLHQPSFPRSLYPLMCSYDLDSESLFSSSLVCSVSIIIHIPHPLFVTRPPFHPLLMPLSLYRSPPDRKVMQSRKEVCVSPTCVTYTKNASSFLFFFSCRFQPPPLLSLRLSPISLPSSLPACWSFFGFLQYLFFSTFVTIQAYFTLNPLFLFLSSFYPICACTVYALPLYSL